MIAFFIYKLIIQTLIYACMIWKHNSTLSIYWIEDYLKNHTTIIKVLVKLILPLSEEPEYYYRFNIYNPFITRGQYIRCRYQYFAPVSIILHRFMNVIRYIMQKLILHVSKPRKCVTFKWYPPAYFDQY